MIELVAMAERDPLSELEDIVRDRKANMPEGSYTASLLREGLPKINEKIREEFGELMQALEKESPQRVVEELADLVYHVTVGLAATGKGSWKEVYSELVKRRC